MLGRLGLLWLLAASLCGCRLIKKTAEVPGRVASAALDSGGKAPSIDPSLLQTRFMRFADIFGVEISLATNEFAERTGTPEGRIQALTWQLDYTNSLWRLASGPRPYAALFDGIVVITALRETHEKRWRAQWGEADQPVLDALLRLEKSVWDLAAEGLTEKQSAEVKSVIDTWLSGDASTRVTDIAKLPGFADLAGKEKESQGGASLFGEITNLLTVDPLAGLEPAVREIAMTRQLAERSFYYLQHVQDIAETRIELMTLRSSNSSEVQETLASVERISQAAASIAATAAALPATFGAEREATLSQLSNELKSQREGLVRDLEAANEPLTKLLGEARATIESSHELSESLTETIHALDGFLGRFDKEKDEGGPLGASAPAEPAASEVMLASTQGPAPSGGSFDIKDYGETAERIGGAARELTTTISTLDRSLPQVEKVLDEAVARSDQTVDRVFRRLYLFLTVALVGSALTVLVVRRLSPRPAR